MSGRNTLTTTSIPWLSPGCGFNRAACTWATLAEASGRVSNCSNTCSSGKP
jgi:hypothetical protein